MPTQTPAAGSIADHIAITSGVCGGKPRIAGHRIKVQHVAVWHERMGLSADEIVSQHPGLTLGDVYAALAYYWDHKAVFDAEIERRLREFDEARRNAGPSPVAAKARAAGYEL